MVPFIPQIGLKGLYRLTTPFDSLLLPGVQYTCIAVRSISDVIAGGDDPEALYYTPNGLADSVYQTDVTNGVSIITLQSDQGNTVYVPSSYLTTFPDAGGVPYTNMALVVNLGPLPDSLDLSYIISKVSDDVMEILGVQTDIKPLAISATSIISNDEDTALQAARAAITGTVSTDYARLLATQTQLTSALQQITELSNFIISLNLPPSPTPTPTPTPSPTPSP